VLADDILQEYMGPCKRIQRFPLNRNKKHAFFISFSDLGKETIDKSLRLEVARFAERAVTRKASTSAPSTEVYDKCGNLFCIIPIDSSRLARAYYEHEFKMKRVEARDAKRRRTHEMV
jgi:hypothetical protein